MEKKMEEGKMSYEELKMALDQAAVQQRQLISQMANMNYTNVFKRLDFLFKVLEHKDSFNSDFVINCSEEIEQILTVPEEEEVEEVEPIISKQRGNNAP